jgi:hypothetical protein
VAVYKASNSGVLTRREYNSFLAGNTAFDPAAFDSISTVTVGSGGASNITFSSIPSTYQHLQVRITAKGNRSIAIENAYLTFNGDSGSNYNSHAIYGDGSSVIAGTNTDPGMLIYTFAGNGGTTGSNVFGAGVVDILDYTNTNKNTTIRSLAGYENNSAGLLGFNSGLWRNTSSVTSLTLTPTGGTAWLQNSSFALYGIKE